MAQLALTSDQLETLRGTDELASSFVGRVRISTNPGTVIYSASVNQASFDNSFAQITYDGGSGTLADVWPGMTLLISRTSDMSKAYFRGRVRATPTSSIIYLNETSVDVHDNDRLFILNDFQIWDRLAREVNGVQYNDYSIAFRQLLPIIYGLPTVCAGDVDPDTGNLTLTLSASLLVTASGASAGTLTWSVGAASITAGNSHTSSITVDVPEGHQYIHLIWPDNAGRTAYFHIEVHAHGVSYPYHLMAVENLSLSRNVGTGDDATLKNYAPVSGLLDLTQITVWSDDTYQNLSGSITGDNILFVGRIRTRDNSTEASADYTLDQSADYTVEGALTQLARIEMLPFEMLNVSSPTKWGDINNLSLYRGIAYLLSEYTTYLEVHSLQFDTFDNTYIAPSKNPSGDILTAVNDLALSINAALQIAPNGRSEVVRNAVMLETSGARNALTTRANVTTSDLISIRLKQDGARPVGRLTASAGSYNTSTGQYIVTEAIAPGTAQGEGSQTATLDRQVLPCNLSQAAADTLLKTRANHAFEKAQQVDTIEATFTPGWHSALIPSLNTWYTFDVPADLTVDGQVIGKTVPDSSIRWLLTSVTVDYNEEGAPNVKASFVRETAGISKGLTVVYPPPATSVLPVLPSVPSIPMFQIPPIGLPDLPTGTQMPVLPSGSVTLQIPLDGNTAIIGGVADSLPVLLMTTTLLTYAYTRNITPPDILSTEEIKQALWNPFGSRKGVYLLTYDTAGDTSRVRYLSDLSAYPAAWSAGDSIVGEYTELRLGNANGKIVILGDVLSSGGSLSLVDTFSISSNSGAYQSGSYPTSIFNYYVVRIIGDTARDHGTLRVDAAWGSANGTYSDRVRQNLIRFSEDGSYPDPDDDTYNSGHTYDYTRHGTGAAFSLSYLDSDYTDNTGSYSVEVYEDAGLGTTGTVYSDDFGATYSSPEPVGAGVLWIDTQKAGTKILVGAAGQAKKADLTGSYADYGSAKTQGCGYIPRYLFPPGTLGNDSLNPQYLLAASALDSGESVWRVSSSGNVFTDVTPASGGHEGLATGPRCLNVHWLSSSHLLAILLFNATVKLAVSVNAGSAWSFSAALDADAFGIVTLKGDRSKKFAAWVNGTKIAFTRNYQANPPVFVQKTIPLDSVTTLDVVG